MPLPKALGMYADVKQVFDTCVTHGGLTLTFPTPAQALQFRQRGYYYRKLLHTKQLESLGVSIGQTSTPYDSIKMTISKDQPLQVRVAEVSIAASMVLDSGLPPPEQLPPPPETTTIEDPLLALALKFSDDL